MLFVDTSALIALGSQADNLHQDSIKLFDHYSQQAQLFLTTNGVLLEFMNTFGIVKLRSNGLRIINEIMNSSEWRVIIIDQQLMELGLERFGQRMDKNWGLVDCISMIVAEQNNIRDIMTADHHFEQAGFNCLLMQK